MTPEEQRLEEENALEKEKLAFEKRQSAFLNVRCQLLPTGNGQPTEESIAKWERAEEEWRKATSDTRRIIEEILSGKRR